MALLGHLIIWVWALPWNWTWQLVQREQGPVEGSCLLKVISQSFMLQMSEPYGTPRTWGIHWSYHRKFIQGSFCFPIHEAELRRQKIRGKNTTTNSSYFQRWRDQKMWDFDYCLFFLLYLSTSIHKALVGRQRGNRSLGRWTEDRNINLWNRERGLWRGHPNAGESLEVPDWGIGERPDLEM